MNNNLESNKNQNENLYDINCENDDFINSYFESDEVLEFKENLSNKEADIFNESITDELPLLERKLIIENFDNLTGIEEGQLYNEENRNNSWIKDYEIKKELVEINETGEILNLIENTKTSDEFFDLIEKGILND